MPYILVRGNLASYGHRHPWRVLVSGLKDAVCILVVLLAISPYYGFTTQFTRDFTSISKATDWTVRKSSDIEQLKRFASGGYSDDSTIVYLQHPCVILTALEVLGYKVVASSSTAVKQDYNEYMWTMRGEFAEPEPLLSKPATTPTS